jgi:pimeloyl-ACP methyl ester carboxylesterase
MPFATAYDGVRINYTLEGPSDGIPLVGLHGFTGSLQSWYDAGYVERLADRFRLLLVDSRGHGDSDKPTRPEDYDNRTRVLDLVAVAHDAGVERPHLWGYSLGGSITQSAAIYAPQRFRSLIIGGSTPYGARDSVVSADFEEFWTNAKDRPGADHDAWAAAHVMTHRFGGAVQALRTTGLPFLMYAGDEDHLKVRGQQEFVEAHGATHFLVPGKNHRGAFHEAAEEVVPRVVAFIEETERASG